MKTNIFVVGGRLFSTGICGGRIGKGASKLSTFITCLIEGLVLLSGLAHQRPTASKHSICGTSNSPCRFGSADAIRRFLNI